jgi:hypothetical protein
MKVEESRAVRAEHCLDASCYWNGMPNNWQGKRVIVTSSSSNTCCHLMGYHNFALISQPIPNEIDESDSNPFVCDASTRHRQGG